MTLLLTSADVASLVPLADQVDLVEAAFHLHATGAALGPAMAHVDADGGEFHIKSGGLRGDPTYVATKVDGGPGSWPGPRWWSTS